MNIVNTVTDNLFKKGKIPQNELGIFFRPVTSGSGLGEIIWGGIDTSKIIGSVNYVPITKTQPASFYWGISQTIQYGGSNILSHTEGMSLHQRNALMNDSESIIKALSILEQLLSSLQLVPLNNISSGLTLPLMILCRCI